MNKQLILGIYILLLFSQALAVEFVSEKNSVSRIVGESPTELITQLKRTSLNIDEATYYSYETSLINKKDNILNEQFGGVDTNLPNYYNFYEIQDSVDSLSNNELFILEAFGGDSFQEVKSASFLGDELSVQDITDWQSSFEMNTPLFIFDAPNAGVYMPKDDTFVSRLVRDSTIIAPSYYNSPEFTKSVLCNLQSGKTIGETFKDARNFHFNGGSSNNYIGLVLQSYNLYGNPRQVISMPSFDIADYCQNNLENLANGIEYLGEVGNYSLFRKHLTYTIDDFEIVNNTIEIPGLNQRLSFGEPIVPVSIRTTYFPKDTIFMNFSVNEISNPESFNLNFSSYEFDFVDRHCYQEEFGEEIILSEGYGKTHNLIAKILPVRIDNCSSGDITLFKQFNYSVDYITLSPVMIKEVSVPSKVYSNEIVNVDVEILNLKDSVSFGSLAVYKGSELITENEINSSIYNHTLSFYAPEEGIHKYSVEFIFENETAHYKEFILESVILEVDASIPVSINEETTINLELYSPLTFDTVMEYYLLKDEEILDSGVLEFEVSGLINQEISFTGLSREDQNYLLRINNYYLGNQKTNTFLLTINNLPLLNVDYDTVFENESFIISFEATDLDNDPLTISIDDENFIQENNSFVWDTEFTDSGDYTVELTVFDGLLTNSLLIPFSIENWLLPMSISGGLVYSNGEIINNSILDVYINNILFSSFEVDTSYSINIPADNFDNYGFFEDDIISFKLDNYDVVETLSFIPEEEISLDLTVLLPNTAPVFDEISDQLINEGYALTIELNVSDPDGDDLTYLLEGPGILFNNTYVWETLFEDSGIYDVSIIVSDFEYSITRTFSIEVLNINRLPVIEEILNQIIHENETLIIELNVSDPDSDELTISLDGVGEIIDETFVFSPEYGSSGIYDVSIIVSDFESSVTENFSIEVLNINLPPVVEFEFDDELVNEVDSISIIVNAVDPDNNELTYSIDNDNFIQENNSFVWETNYEDSGIYNFTITVSDSEYFVTNDFMTEILNTNRPPTFTIIPSELNLTYFEGDLIEFYITVSDPDNENSVSNDDNDLSISSNSDFLQQDMELFYRFTNYSDSGVYDVSFLISDGDFNIMTPTYIVTVVNVNLAPVIVSVPTTEVYEGELYTYNIQIYDSDGDEVFLSVNGPEGMFIENNVLLWYTEEGDSGTYDISLEASDNNLSSFQNFELTVNNLVNPPELFNIQENITTYSGSISWETDIPSTYEFVYGTDDIETVISSDVLSYAASLLLSFNDDTAYTYEITSCNEDNECSSSGSLEFTTLLAGDMNFDGVITSMEDIIPIVDIILTEEYTELAFIIADVNNDGGVNVLDIVELVNLFSVYSSDSLTINGGIGINLGDYNNLPLTDKWKILDSEGGVKAKLRENILFINGAGSISLELTNSYDGFVVNREELDLRIISLIEEEEEDIIIPSETIVNKTKLKKPIVKIIPKKEVNKSVKKKIKRFK